MWYVNKLNFDINILHKILQFFSYVGYFLIYFSIAVISFISTRIEINPWYYIIAYIPVSFFGGTCAFITATYCYIIDNTNQENRARRLNRTLYLLTFNLTFKNYNKILLLQISIC